MGKSTKLPVCKDNYKGRSQLYWRRVKRTTKNYIKSHIRELDNIDFNLNIPDPKNIVNDYDYCDYVISCLRKRSSRWYTSKDFDKDRIKFSRK